MTLTPYHPHHATAPALSGLITGMPESAYHARPEISKHDADLCWKAPVLYRDKHRLKRKPSADMVTGTVAGAMLLGLPYDELAAEVPAGAPRRPTQAQRDAAKPSEKTLEAIQWWDEFAERAGDKPIITQVDLSGFRACVEEVQKNPDVAKLLARPVASEVSMFWICPVTGLARRGRPDRIREGNIVIDLKKTACADVRAFQRQIVEYRYDVQAAEYVDGLKELTGEDFRFYWICYESDAPYLSACYEASDSMLALGRVRRDRAVRKISECIQSGVWGGYQTGIPVIEPPTWIAREENL